MTLELRIAGPGLDVVRAMAEGDAELVLGRDAECEICLPDPRRNVSRRHLSVWVAEGELRFRVLSEVNGVEMSFGEAPPGAQGVLATGELLKLGDYEVTVAPAAIAATASPPSVAEPDPWAVFDRDGSGVAPVAPEDDPFGEWGFGGDTFGPGGVGGGPLEAGKLGEGGVASFFHGLGMDPATLGALSQGELEAIGRAVRIVVLGVLELHSAAAAAKQELKAEDRTMVAPKDSNPLKTDWPKETKLRYLFGGRATGVGFPNPERALRELLVELIAHNSASAAAARSALESTVKEFAPATLKTRLLGEGTKLFEGTRAWDAYARFYEEEARDMAQWTQRLLDRYFADAYLRESLRIRRETPTRER